MYASIIFGVSCIFMPLIAWGVINQEWEFVVPLIDVTYKPWRLYLVVRGLPGLMSVIILTFLPESPKFVLNQGNHEKAYEILETINRINNGKKSNLEIFEIHEEIESIENRQRILDSKKGRFPFLSSVWIQTAPLFKPPYLCPTILICFIQFCIFATVNGFYMFFTDILNKMATNLDNFSSQRVMLCDIINMKTTHINGTDDEMNYEVRKFQW